jgi:hypothetical protein
MFKYWPGPLNRPALLILAIAGTLVQRGEEIRLIFFL